MRAVCLPCSRSLLCDASLNNGAVHALGNSGWELDLAKGHELTFGHVEFEVAKGHSPEPGGGGILLQVVPPKPACHMARDQEPLLDRPVASLIGLAITLIESCYFQGTVPGARYMETPGTQTLLPGAAQSPQKHKKSKQLEFGPASPSLKLSLLSPTSLEGPWGQNQVSEQTFWASRAWEARIQLSG